jgi:hypothetical protein
MIGEQETMAELFGFEAPAPVVRVAKPDGCYVKLTEGNGRTRCSLMLDGKTSDSVTDTFGDRVQVQVDRRGNVMIAQGDRLAVGQRSKSGVSRISIEREAAKLKDVLGGLGNHPYEVVWDDQIIILSPSKTTE